MKFCIKFIIVFLIILGANSCIVVKYDNIQSDVEPKISLSPKPEIKMSDIIVRSEKGDMIAFLPADWFFVNVESDVSPDIFAVAVNKDYNLSLVFSALRLNEAVTEQMQESKILSLARLSLDRRSRKSGGIVEHIGKFGTLKMGNLEFAKYEFTTTGGALTARSAVFTSTLGHNYEISLIPLNDVSLNPIPPAEDLDKMFFSILASVKY